MRTKCFHDRWIESAELPPSMQGTTKAALAAAKARGVQLGNPKNLENWNRSRTNAARKFAEQHSHFIWSLRNKGRSLREFCEVVIDAGITTAQGGVFHQFQITRILHRSPNPALATVNGMVKEAEVVA